jgi:hypothetical protein
MRDCLYFELGLTAPGRLASGLFWLTAAMPLIVDFCFGTQKGHNSPISGIMAFL